MPVYNYTAMDAKGREHGPWSWTFDIEDELERSRHEDNFALPELA